MKPIVLLELKTTAATDHRCLLPPLRSAPRWSDAAARRRSSCVWCATAWATGAPTPSSSSSSWRGRACPPRWATSCTASSPTRSRSTATPPAAAVASTTSKWGGVYYMHVKSTCYLHLHSHLGHLADAFIQSNLQRVHLLKERQQYITVVRKDKNRVGFKHS